ILTYEDVNVIVVDWTVYSRLSYSRADSHVAEVAMNIHLFIRMFSLNLNLLHLVGFNLGAHIVGHTGRLYPGIIRRITALDPSKSNNRLRRTDAVYVEVIHTDGGCPLSNGLGIVLGDLDFFPNGGTKQPGCWGSNTCDHNRAWWYFAASQTPGTFMASCCSSKTQMTLNNCRRNGEIKMGGNDLAPKNGCPSGILRIETGRSYPFY
ncbi:pancreatic triacylglycerol lipase-like, partial [Achroia grisella]|uniref:pancreatic triacylglycerol lipase-like n=1 Tax=Achroia grisella TaxID=688607 RepID=UPI0027D342BE